MSEKPILFSAPMVRAILDGRKTQTRRVMKPQPDAVHDGEPYWFIGGYRAWIYRGNYSDVLRKGGNVLPCPYGKLGDRLYVRETWRYRDWTEDGEPEIEYRADSGSRLVCGHEIPPEWGDRLSDIWAGLSDPSNYAIDQRAADRRWRPAIHMPRWASRITLEITGIRVERLQDISEADAIAEGVQVDSVGHAIREGDDVAWGGARAAYAELWESINGTGSWAADPCVWVVEFMKDDLAQ